MSTTIRFETSRSGSLPSDATRPPQWPHFSDTVLVSLLGSMYSSVRLLTVKVIATSERLTRLDLPAYDKLLGEHERELDLMIKEIEATAEARSLHYLMVGVGQELLIARTPNLYDPTNTYDMFADLYVDNLVIASQLRASVRRASEAEDLPYAESCEKWLQDTERRASFLLEACQGTD